MATGSEKNGRGRSGDRHLTRRDALSSAFGGVLGAALMGGREVLSNQPAARPPVPADPIDGSTAPSAPVLNLADWVDVSGAKDATSGIRAALASLRRGGVVTGPAGAIYTCSDEIVIPHDGITLDFQGSHPSLSPWPTLFDFSAIGSGKNCFSAKGKRGLSFRNFNLQATNGRGGAGIQILNSSKLDVSGVVLTLRRGSGAYGIQLGDRSSGDNAVIASAISNCVVSAEGVPFFVGAGCTSVGLLHDYALNASGEAGYHFFRSTYCGADYCACDSATGGAYGYRFSGAVAVGLRGCGAEAIAMGFALITGDSHGISLETCRGVGNNTSGDRAIGSFVEIAGGHNYNIKIDTCEDTRPHASSTVNIRAGMNTGKTTIIGYNSESFPMGYSSGSDRQWLTANFAVL